jgi:1-acyl-sn-glycerol-3-phosphate acyltransferase
MRWLRGALIADPAIILATILFGSISLVISFFDSGGKAQAAVARVWAKTLLWASGIRVAVEGLEHIDPSGSYIFMSNHTSYIDTPVVLANISVQFRFLAKSGLFQIPFLGTHLSRAGHIPVPREDPRAAVRTLQLAAETVQKKKTSLLVFPEGGRSEDGDLAAFKEGGAYIAIRAGVPMVPLVLIGGAGVLPYGGGVVQSGQITMRILPPIETAQLTLKDRGAVTERVRNLLLAELSPARAVANYPVH